MNIVVCCKVTPDDQDIQVAGDRSLDFSKAKPAVSTYDLNAIEVAAQIAAANEGSKVYAVTAGAASIDDSKLKKNILARGADELVMAAADELDGMDSHATAEVLAGLIEGLGADLILCGDGSADEYAQQVEIQLADKLGLPVVTAAAKLSVSGSTASATRALEDCSEQVEVDLPAVISVTPDVATPRIPGMKDILAAGKKPMNISAPAAPAATLTTAECAAPEKAARANVVVEASEDGAIDKLVAAVKAAL